MKARTTLAAALFVLFGLPAAPVNAQAASETLVGQRLRLTTNGEGSTGKVERIVGTLVSTDETGLTLAAASSGSGNRTLKVSHAAVTRAEMSTRKSRKRSWALIGAATGAVIGGVLGYSAPVDCSPNDFVCLLVYPKENQNRAQYTVAGALIFGAAGAGLGALIAPGEKWQDAGTQRLRLSLAPTPHRGARVAITLGF